ncbi:SRPBCC domain-containing protein [Kitasatospora sp. NPDC051914]|uniref:SRPBCC domain-containing protein n=1 Tax=Kitasatospora sp. NPDC051914 TaxID=3154945 RepID=UPI00343A71FC
MQENESRTDGHTISTTVTVAAPPERVWEVLTAFDRYDTWHPSLEILRGEPRAGAALAMRIAAGTPQERSAEGTVVAAEAPRLLAWEGGMPGLLWGRHSFELVPDGAGTRVVNSESFSGSMAADVLAANGGLLEEEFRAADAALRSAAEGGSATGRG